ncbi:MAG: LysE family transporter [Burkholderiaceae bacterium]
MSFEHWLLYLLAAIGLSLTPGPNGLLVLTQAIRFGARPAAYSALGGVIGFLALVGASLAGLGALLAASEQAFWIAKLIGAAYLVVLGIQLWRAPAGPGMAVTGLAADGGERARPVARPLALFRQGLLIAVSNPKALIFFAAFLPQFMVPGMSLWLHFLILGGTFAAVELVYELLVAGMAGRIAPWLSVHGRLFNRAAGSLFILIGGLLARTQR